MSQTDHSITRAEVAASAPPDVAELLADLDAPLPVKDYRLPISPEAQDMMARHTIRRLWGIKHPPPWLLCWAKYETYRPA